MPFSAFDFLVAVDTFLFRVNFTIYTLRIFKELGKKLTLIPISVQYSGYVFCCICLKIQDDILLGNLPAWAIALRPLKNRYFLWSLSMDNRGNCAEIIFPFSLKIGIIDLIYMRYEPSFRGKTDLNNF